MSSIVHNERKEYKPLYIGVCIIVIEEVQLKILKIVIIKKKNKQLHKQKCNNNNNNKERPEWEIKGNL